MKYRGWNKKTQKMYGVDGFRLLDNKIYRLNLADDEFQHDHETCHYVEDTLDDYIVMESTELKDRDGEMIYVDDLVELKPHVYATPELFRVIRHRGGAFRFENQLRGYELWLRHHDCKVVGNIYNNKNDDS